MNKFANEVEAADALHEKYTSLKTEINKIIVGQDEVVKLVLSSLFCHAHSLLVGVPGLAKHYLLKL